MILSRKKSQTFTKKNCTKILEYILYVQISYYNESGLGFEKENEMKNDFPNVKERLRHRPSNHFYKNNFGK